MESNKRAETRTARGVVVMLPPFKLYRPESIEEALEILDEHGENVVPMAGGTKLLLLMRWGLSRPSYVLDVKSLKLNRIIYNNNKLTIEAGVTLNDILESDIVRRKFPLLYESVENVADNIIRNQATLIGNIVDATPYATLVPAFLLLNGKAILSSKKGERLVEGLDFFVDVMKTAQKPNELVAALQFEEINGVGKFAEFKGDSLFAVVNVASLKYTKDGKDVIKVSIMGLTNKPVLLDLSEMFIDARGNIDAFLRKVRDYIYSEFKDSAISDLRASSEYRLHITSVLIKRTLEVVLHG